MRKYIRSEKLRGESSLSTTTSLLLAFDNLKEKEKMLTLVLIAVCILAASYLYWKALRVSFFVKLSRRLCQDKFC